MNPRLLIIVVFGRDQRSRLYGGPVARTVSCGNNGGMSQPEIIPADKRLRRRTIVLTVALGVVGLIGMVWLKVQLWGIEELAEDNLPAAIEKTLWLSTIVAWVAGLSFVGMGAWLWRLGWRINRAGRFPPPGMKVIKDTPVRTGVVARRVADLSQLAAFSCIVVGTVGMWYFYGLAVAVLRR